MKKIASIILCFSFVLILVGCGSGPKRESAESVVDKYLSDIQNGKIENFALDQETQSVESDSIALEEDVVLKIIENFEYEILSSVENEEDGTAVVSVECTNIDMTSAMADFMAEAINLAFSYAFLDEALQPTEEELNEKYIELLETILTENEYDLVALSADVSLFLNDENEWEISEDNAAFFNAILGGMPNAFAELE